MADLSKYKYVKNLVKEFSNNHDHLKEITFYGDMIIHREPHKRIGYNFIVIHRIPEGSILSIHKDIRPIFSHEVTMMQPIILYVKNKFDIYMNGKLQNEVDVLASWSPKLEEHVSCNSLYNFNLKLVYDAIRGVYRKLESNEIAQYIYCYYTKPVLRRQNAISFFILSEMANQINGNQLDDEFNAYDLIENELNSHT